MTDLERFFRRLVGNLASSDPARLHRPLPLDDILQTIMPYRANRRALRLDSSEEYELVVMRLCAGEGGLARTDPEEARARFAQELGSANPDLAVLHSFEGVVVTLRSEPLARALGPDHGSRFAPEPEAPGGELPVEPPLPALPEFPGLQPLAEPEDAEELEPESVAPAEPATRCAYCGGRLPPARGVNFCPHCGQSQRLTLCPECRAEVEPGWRHCVHCGCAIPEGRGA